MQALIEKAGILHEALPYIREFHGAILVVKYGGHAMVDPALRESFARDIVLMRFVGLRPVVVHGGGPQIDEVLTKMGARSERVEGLRITDARTMEVVEMVLGGKVNQEIVSLVARHGGNPVGLTGKDAKLLVGERIERMQTRSGEWVDPGRVGRIVKANPDLVLRLVSDGFIPVIAPVAADEEGGSLNVNADTVAAEMAKALGARKLVLMTDIDGVRGEGGELLSTLTKTEAEELYASEVITGGMIPKVKCALDAIEGGVGKAHIIDGRMRHAVLLELFTDQGVGTQIVS